MYQKKPAPQIGIGPRADGNVLRALRDVALIGGGGGSSAGGDAARCAAAAIGADLRAGMVLGSTLSRP